MSKKIDKIYFDMDGVLVDLEPTLIQFENVFLTSINEVEIPDNFKKDPFIYLINKHIDKNPFIWAQPTPEFNVLRGLIHKWQKRGIVVEILSSGTKNPETYPKVCAQKEIWLKRYLPDIKYHFAQGGSTKHKWAAPTHLLIDDYEPNINDWRNAGGIALQFKTDYNAGVLRHHSLTILEHLDLLGL